MSGSVLLRREEESNCTINIIYLNIFLVLGIVLCLSAPILIYIFTGINIYNNSSITDSVYSMSLFNIRICCATVFLHLLIYFFVLNKNRIKLSRLKYYKPIMGASSFIVKGGFEGLEATEIEEQHVTHKPMRTFNSSKIKDLEVDLPLTLSDTQKESHSKDSSTSFPRLNPEVHAVTVPLQPEGSNAETSSERRKNSGYPFWPRHSPALNLPILPESNSEPAPKCEVNKKVRINEYTEVKKLSELGLENTKEKIYESIQTEPKNKYHKHRAVEGDKNIFENSDPSNSNTLKYLRKKQISRKID